MRLAMTFAPRAVMPANSNASISAGPTPIAPVTSNDKRVEQTAPKVRRNPDNYQRVENLNYCKKHPIKETLLKFPEISKSIKMKRMIKSKKSIRAMAG